MPSGPINLPEQSPSESFSLPGCWLSASRSPRWPASPVRDTRTSRQAAQPVCLVNPTFYQPLYAPASLLASSPGPWQRPGHSESRQLSGPVLEAAGRAGWWSHPAVSNQSVHLHTQATEQPGGSQWAEPNKISSSTQGFDLQWGVDGWWWQFITICH